jgi:hypothetical protein
MKQIIAWVNKWDRKQFDKFKKIDIYFSSSLEDFEEHLNKNSLPLFSLGLAGRTLKKTTKIITSHPELRFYFLEKRTKNWNLENPDWKVRNFENTEGSLLDFQEVFPLLNEPPVIPKRILETNLLIHEEASLSQ